MIFPGLRSPCYPQLSSCLVSANFSGPRMQRSLVVSWFGPHRSVWLVKYEASQRYAFVVGNVGEKLGTIIRVSSPKALTCYADASSPIVCPASISAFRGYQKRIAAGHPSLDAAQNICRAIFKCPADRDFGCCRSGEFPSNPISAASFLKTGMHLACLASQKRISVGPRAWPNAGEYPLQASFRCPQFSRKNH